MPITKQITETKTRTVTLLTLQEYADKVLDPPRPLLTIEEACAKNGWPFQDRPECCGQPVKIESFLGSAYHAECPTCRKYVHSMTGPTFGNSWVNFLDSEKVDLYTEACWIVGVNEKEEVK